MYNLKIKSLILSLALVPLSTAAFAGFTGDFAAVGGALYDGGDMDMARGIAVDTFTAGGPFIYTIGTSSIGVNNQIMVIKYDPSGVNLTTATWPINGTDAISGFVAVNTNGVYVSVQEDGVGYLTIKYDKDLVFLSSASYVTDSANQAVALDNSGNVFVTGGANGNYTTVKYDANLNAPVPVILDLAGDDHAYAIDTDGAGNVYLAGYTIQGTLPDVTTHYVMVKYDNSLGFISSTTFSDSPYVEDGFSMGLAVDKANGFVYVAGTYGTENDRHMMVLKYADDLVFQSSAVWPTGQYGLGRDVTLDASGNVYALGKETDEYAIVAKLSPNLVLLSSGTSVYNSKDFYPMAMGIDTGTGYTYVAGIEAVAESDASMDFRTVKMSPLSESQTVSVSYTDVSPANYTVGQEAAALKITPYTLSGSVDFTGLQVRINPAGAYTDIASAALYDDTNPNGIWDQADTLLSSGTVISADHFFDMSGQGGIIDTVHAPLFIALTPDASAVGHDVNVAVLSTAAFSITGGMADQDIYPVVSVPKPVQSAAGGFSGDFNSAAAYDGGDMDAGVSVVVDTITGGGPYVYVVGYSSPTEGLAVKYDPDGNMVSSSTMAGVTWRAARLNGSYLYVTGELQDVGYITAQYDLSLGLVSSATLSGGVNWGPSRDIAIDAGGNVFVAGDASGTGDYRFVKYNAGLVQQGSVVAWDAGGADEARGIAADNGYVYIIGDSLMGGATYFVTAKFDAGTLAFVSSVSYAGAYVDPENPSGEMLAVNPVTHDVYLVASASHNDIVTLRYSQDLNFLGSEVFNSSFYAQGADVETDSEGNVYVLGGYNNGGDDYPVVIKYSPSLVLISSAMSVSEYGFEPVGLARNPSSGMLYVTGVYFSNGNTDTPYWDARTVRFAPLGGSAPVTVYVDAADVSPANYTDGEEAAALKITPYTLSGSVDFTGLQVRINPAGAYTDIASAALYDDTNPNGIWDQADTLLSSGTVISADHFFDMSGQGGIIDTVHAPLFIALTPDASAVGHDVNVAVLSTAAFSITGGMADQDIYPVVSVPKPVQSVGTVPQPVTGLSAIVGTAAGSVRLSWNYQEELSAGATIYIQYSTSTGAWDINNAQIKYIKGYPINPGSDFRLVPVGAWFDPTGSNLTPQYYFAVWVHNDAFPSSPASTVSGVQPMSSFSVPATSVTAAAYITQAPNYQNDDYNFMAKIARDTTGYIYAINSMPASQNSGDPAAIHVRKYGPQGNVLWTSVFSNGSGSSDFGRSLTVTPAGNVIAVGTVYDNSTYNDIWVRKFDPSGNILWTRTCDHAPHGYSSYDYAYDVKADSNYVYVTGQSAYSVWIGKFDLNTGALVAETRVNNAYNYDSGNALAIAPDGNLIVGGGVQVYDESVNRNYGRDIWLGKFKAADLAKVWVSTYVPSIHNSYDTDEINAVRTDSKGNIYVSGYLTTDTGNDIFVAKYDQNGNQVFARTKNGPANGWDKGFGIDLDSIGNIYAVGKLETWNEGQNIWVGKYNSNGSLMSERSVNFQDEVGYDIKVSSAGEMYVAAGLGHQFGIVRLAAEAGGGTATQTQLSAAPGEETASVDLAWMVNEPGTYEYRIQYATSTDVAWSTAAAQKSGSFTTVDFGVPYEVRISTLPTYIQFAEYSQPVTLPVYHFKVWLGTQPVNAEPVASAPQAPAVNWDTSYANYTPGGMEQDSAMAFTSAPDGAGGAVARDALGNAYVVHGLGSRWKGFVIVKVNPQGRVLTASFYNNPLGAQYIVTKALVSGANLYLAGSEDITGIGERAWLAKFNLLGMIVWQKRLGAPGAGMKAEDLALDDSGIYITGSDNTDNVFRVLLARYDADGTLISSTTYKPDAYDHASGYTLALDDYSNIYVGGAAANGFEEPYEEDRALWKFTTALAASPALEKLYLSSGSDTTDDESFYSVTVSSLGVFAAGSVYRHAPALGGYDWYVAKIDTATLNEVWTSSYNSKSNGRDEAEDLLLMDGSLYAVGYEMTNYNGANIVVAQYDPAAGTRGWTKIMDGLWNRDNAVGGSILPGVNGGFYVGATFQMYDSGGDVQGGKPGYARIYAPVTGLLAQPGWKPCSVNLSWIADTQLDIGTTFYIQYSTVSADFTLSASTAQVSFVTDVNVFSGRFVNHLVAGLEAGITPAAANHMDSPPYYFKLGYMLGGALQTVDGSTSAAANTPGIWWRTDRYSNGTLDIASLLHGERHPVARDSAGGVYTAGTFAPWGGNTNTAAVRKVSATGVTQWVKFYADEYASSRPQINGLAVDSDNNVYAVGRHGYGAVSGAYTPGGNETVSATAQDILLLKYAPGGRLLWKRSLDYARGDDTGYAISLSTSNIYIAGEVSVSASAPSKAFIAKLDMDGALISSATYGAADKQTMFLGLAYDAADGLVFTAGRKFADDYDMVVKAYDADLGETLETTIHYGYDDTAFSVRVDTVSEPRAVYVAGAAGDEDAWDAYLARLSTACDIAWERTYNSANENRDEAGGVALDGLAGPDGKVGVYIAGTEYRYDINQGKNLFFRKYNSAGDLIWTQTFNSAGSNDDEGDGIAADREGNVYAAADAMPQGWNADTSNTGGTASGTGVNGSGYFKYRQVNLATVNPRLTVVVNGSSGALAGVPVNFLGFNQTGGIDPNAITSTVTNSVGVCSASLPVGRNYFIAVSSHNMVPTIKDQISDPMGSFFVTLNADTTKQYSLYQRANQAADPVHVLTINITGGLTAGDYVMGEIYINRTSEKVGYSIIRATAAAGQMSIYNVPPADYGNYGIALNIPARNKFRQVYMEDSFPAQAVYNVEMSSAMTGTFDVGGSTTPPLLTGMVSDMYGSPLEGARVIMERYECTGTPPNSFCQEVFRADSLTDVAGKFAFYTLPYAVNLNLNVRKAGYESQGRGVTLAAPASGSMPVPRYEDFQLAQATYTLSGVLKYNGVPLPNANIWVHGDWMGYSAGYDSYRQCQWGGCGVRSETSVKTGADGSFTVAGITDGNARVEASFEGGWRSFTDGGSYDTTSDDMRVVVSSQGARVPYISTAAAVGKPCQPGRVWVINSSGACVTAGSVAFNITPEGGNTGGLVSGNITFVTTYTVTAAQPLVISTSSPLTVMIQQECMGDCRDLKLGFTSISGAYTTNKATYSVVLSTGFGYWSRILSSEWARASSIENSIDLTSTNTYRMDMTVTKSGALSGALKMPDGTNFRPNYGNYNSTASYWAGLDIRGVNVDGSYGLQVDDNGEFEFPNLAPGLYDISIYPNGAGFIWAMEPLRNVTISVGKTSKVQLQLQSGLAVKPQIYGLPEISTPSWGYHIIAVDSGEEMNQRKVTELFFSEPKYAFEYSTATGWAAKWMTPGQYDFYLIVAAKFHPNGGNYEPQSFQQFANFIGRVKGVAIQKSETNPNIGTRAQPIPINILGSVGQESMSGTVKGGKIFTDADFVRVFANFDSEIEPLIPAVMIYDSAGDLRGFSHAMPDQYAIGGFEQGIKDQDKDIVISTLAAHPLAYYIWGLPPGRYTAVFANPNYPPVAEEISLPADSAHNFDFEARDIAVGAISGVIKSSAAAPVPLEGARVYLKHRTVEKVTMTDAAGGFEFVNLPPGIYRMEILRDGYVTIGQKTTLAGSLTGDDSRSFELYMTPSDSVISGRVYLSKFPNPLTKAGVEIVAYDESLNTGELPDGSKLEKVSYLPKMTVQTNGSGEYEITGVVPGHLYKISAFYSGKLPQTLEVAAEEGATVVEDITMKDVPPQITIKVRKSGDSDNKLDVIIKSPKELIAIPACKYNPGQVFSATAAVSLALVPGPGNTFVGQFTMTASQLYYTVKVTAGDGGNKMEKLFVYEQNSKAKTEQYIQEAAMAGGEVQMDKESEEYSGIELDPGALSFSTTTETVDFSNLVGGFFSALPSVRTVKTSKGNLTIDSAIQELMASEVYDMNLDKASANKPFTLTLKYDKENPRALTTSSMKIYQYDSSTGEWKEVPGNYTVDPMLGVVSVEVASLESAYEGSGGATTPLGRKRLKMSSVKNGRYVPSSTTSQNGQFAVFTAKPGTGTTYAGGAFDVYNMPNPFSLKAKNVVISADGGAAIAAGAYSTRGTIIKYHLPANKSGSVKFVIYNLAGEKVRTLDEGVRTGGYVYYSEWDGKNDKNTDCASGVYFMLTYLNGSKLGNRPHKLAIIK